MASYSRCWSPNYDAVSVWRWVVVSFWRHHDEQAAALLPPLHDTMAACLSGRWALFSSRKTNFVSVQKKFNKTSLIISFNSLVKVQHKISMGMNMLQYFTTRMWDFRSEKVDFIKDLLTSEDLELFPISMEKVDFELYMKNCLLGARQYYLKEPLSALPKARVQLKMWVQKNKNDNLLNFCFSHYSLRVLDVVTTIFWCFLGLWILKYFVETFLLHIFS